MASVRDNPKKQNSGSAAVSSDRAYIDSFLGGLIEAIKSISPDEIEHVITLLYDAWLNGHTVFLIGNGGSAGTATHFASDLVKCTISPDRPRFKAIALTDNAPLISALTNDDGWENVYTEQLKTFFRPGDLVLALSVHGGSGSDKAGPWSQNLLKAMKYAHDHGGKTIALTGFDGGLMKQFATACLNVPAASTPYVESLHVALHHLIAFRLAQKIAAADQPI